MRILKVHANEREPIAEAVAGDIVALVGLKETATGDTLCDRKAPIVLESMHFPDPVISMRIEPKTSADRDKMTETLARLAREDPTFLTRVDVDTGETIIEGMGELHLEVLTNRLTRDFGVGANVGKPRVAYRQTASAPADAEASFERQIASKVHAASVRLRIEPADVVAGVEFNSAVAAGGLPAFAALAVERGVKGAAQGSVGFAYPTIHLRVTFVSGRVPVGVDPSEIAFEAAASDAFGKAFDAGSPKILEPVMRFEVTTPNEFLGDILSDLNRRRASVNSSEMAGNLRVLTGRVPLSSMFGYSTSVRSLSQGRASHSMEPAGYAEAPPDVAKAMSF